MLNGLLDKFSSKLDFYYQNWGFDCSANFITKSSISWNCSKCQISALFFLYFNIYSIKTQLPSFYKFFSSSVNIITYSPSWKPQWLRVYSRIQWTWVSDQRQPFALVLQNQYYEKMGKSLCDGNILPQGALLKNYSTVLLKNFSDMFQIFYIFLELTEQHIELFSGTSRDGCF